jgi:hypothetical protein
MPEPARPLRRGALVLTGLLLAAGAARAAPRIRVGPEILVSGSISHPQAETMVAANPRDPRNLVGGSMSLIERSIGTRTYVTLDGGSTWENVPLPRQARDGGDPQVAFTPRGTAVYMELPTVEADGHATTPIHVWRSETGGRSWEKAAEIPGSWDHPVIAIDPGNGRVYVAVLYRKEPRVALFRSDDDGRTFSGPVQVATTDGGKLSLTVTPPLILHDGTVVFTWFEFPLEPPEGRPSVNRFWCAASRDGGKTFSPPVRIGEGIDAVDLNSTAARLSSLPQTVIDLSEGPARDRLFLFWTDFRTGRARIRFTSSRDAGKTWSESREVNAGFDPAEDRFQPALAVNSRGVLGLLWFGGSHSAYDAWFSASLDGGETFLPAARVSRETSKPEAAGNLAPNPVVFQAAQGTLRLALRSTFARYPTGGDYIGLAADASGDFHPFWPDSRSGRFQIYSARVRVDEREDVAKTLETVRAEVRSRLDVVFDPASYDPATSEVRVPVRLRNRSDRPVYGPIEIKVVGSGKTAKNLYKEFTPALLNASNGQPGAGAVFDYSKTLGDFDRLEPGEVTSAIVWRLRMVDPLRTPDLHLEIWGSVEK